MEKYYVAYAAVLTGMGVILGAFGAHYISVGPEQMEWWKTATFYHLVHSLGLFAVAWIYFMWPGVLVNVAAFCFILGIFLFSGSLYTMALTNYTLLGAVTPVGGLILIVGWVCIAWRVLKSPI